MHTEEQAKELWRPHVRVLEPSFYKRGAGTRGELIGHEPASVNRKTKDKDTNCIGSKCSQWRWCKVVHYTEVNDADYKGVFGAPASPPQVEVKNSDKGYCGLAGTP